MSDTFDGDWTFVDGDEKKDYSLTIMETTLVDGEPVTAAKDMTGYTVELEIADSDYNLIVRKTMSTADATTGIYSAIRAATDTPGAGEYLGRLRITEDATGEARRAPAEPWPIHVEANFVEAAS